MKQKILYAGITEKGIYKERNCDKVFVDDIILDDELCKDIESETYDYILAVICDGAGKTGGTAAEIAVRELSNNNKKTIDRFNIKRILSDINIKIIKNHTEKERGISASTVSGVLINDCCYTVFNIGDTHVYSIQEGKLRLISQDHVGKNGELVRYLGSPDCFYHPSISYGKMQPDTIFVICSDGIYKHIAEILLGSIAFTKEHSLLERCNLIIEEAKKNDAKDDLSIIIIEVTEVDI